MYIFGISLFVAVIAFLLYRFLRPPAGMVFDLDDPRAAAAKQMARESLPEFWAALEAGAESDSEFGLKFDLNHGRGLPDRELIWALDITCRDGIIRGTLGNPPINPDFRHGQEVKVNPDAIVDWCFFRNGVAHGHHLTRLMIDLSPERHARNARQALGW